jgi:hypothetical protein
MPVITISYRRKDSDAITGRIRDRIAQHFGADSVFMDIDSIPLGIDFRKHIHKALQENQILLVIIGPNWTGAVENAPARILDPADPVRIEVETALRRDIPTIPVLVGGATMPGATELPESLKDLPFYNAAEVSSGVDFHTHVDRLIRAIEQIFKGKRSVEIKAQVAAASPAWRMAGGGVLIVCAVLIVFLVVYQYYGQAGSRPSPGLQTTSQTALPAQSVQSVPPPTSNAPTTLPAQSVQSVPPPTSNAPTALPAQSVQSVPPPTSNAPTTLPAQSVQSVPPPTSNAPTALPAQSVQSVPPPTSNAPTALPGQSVRPAGGAREALRADAGAERTDGYGKELRDWLIKPPPGGALQRDENGPTPITFFEPPPHPHLHVIKTTELHDAIKPGGTIDGARFLLVDVWGDSPPKTIPGAKKFKSKYNTLGGSFDDETQAALQAK